MIRLLRLRLVAVASQVATAAAPDGCDLIPVADIERLIGPIESRRSGRGKGAGIGGVYAGWRCRVSSPSRST
ncbi:MAG: hypothetical protein ABIY46_05825 [Gemmatimonadales bacterium]